MLVNEAQRLIEVVAVVAGNVRDVCSKGGRANQTEVVKENEEPEEV